MIGVLGVLKNRSSCIHARGLLGISSTNESDLWGISQGKIVKDIKFHGFLRKQIPVLMVLSLFPGLGYLFLGWLYHIPDRAVVWYALIVLVSLWGYKLYRDFSPDEMSVRKRDQWYRELTYFYYVFFALWTLIFVFYAGETVNNLHYIAIFTQIGASVVASTLLSSDRRLFAPIILILMVPLTIYFLGINEWYGYVLAIFSLIFTWVLFYSARSSYTLLLKTEYQATHDHLTGLYNRRYFISALQQMMNSLKSTKQSSYLLLIDLDHFKTINDSLGHDVGDKLLQQVSERLGSRMPLQAVLARLGGDEFIIAGPEFDSLSKCQEQALKLSNSIISALKDTYVVDRHHLYISSSIGVSMITSGSGNANHYIKEADIAMYEVKAKGRDGVFLFDKEMAGRVEEHLEIERMLHFALQKEEMELHYQPKLDKYQKVVGAEALVRWNNNKLGYIPPMEFIPIAEQTGIIIELGNFIIESSFKTLRDLHDQGIELDQFSINISMRQFYHHQFVKEVGRLVHSYLDDVLCSKIIFELTETIVAEDIGKVVRIMEELRKLGIRFSMDDFGTGYSSLSYLKQLPIDEIKIDRSFVRELGEYEGDQAMIVTILKMAKIFGLRVVAEGVETAPQLEFLKQFDCNYYQGYYFSKPLPKAELEKYIEINRRSGSSADADNQ
jgi:diguanylate cyclase